jgi:hypothetical protein
MPLGAARPASPSPENSAAICMLLAARNWQ